MGATFATSQNIARRANNPPEQSHAGEPGSVSNSTQSEIIDDGESVRAVFFIFGLTAGFMIGWAWGLSCP